MNSDLNVDKRGLQFFICCSGFYCDLLGELMMHAWINFVRQATPGKVHHCSLFSPFVDNSSPCGSLRP